MYFGDWLRSSEVVHAYYLSFTSKDPQFPQKINDLLGRDAQVHKLSSTCLLLESTETKQAVVKKLQKYISPDDEVVFLFRHQRMVAYQVLHPAEKI